MNNDIRRFYNGETKQIHRFIPLFQNIDGSKVIGICMDTDKNGYWGVRKVQVPIIRRGQRVLVDKPNGNRLDITYKDEKLFSLSEVGYEDCLPSREWKDYEEMN